MRLSYLREFVAFSKTCNYTTTAKELYLAQPTLIQHIQKLERDLGFELVTHDGQPRLTELGAFFCAKAEQSLTIIDDAIEWCLKREMAQSERVRIVDQQMLFDSEFFDRLARIDTAMPPVFVAFDERNRTELEVLDTGEADFSVIVTASNDLTHLDGIDLSRYEFIELKPMSCVALMPQNSRLADKTLLRLDDLNGCSLIADNRPFYEHNTASLKAHLNSRGVSANHVRVPVESVFVVLKTDPTFVSIVVERAETFRKLVLRDDELIAIPIDPSELTLHPWAIYRPDNPNPAVAQLAELWKAFLTSNLSES